MPSDSRSWLEHGLDFAGCLSSFMNILLAFLQLALPVEKPSSLALDRARGELWLVDFENNQLACYYYAGH